MTYPKNRKPRKIMRSFEEARKFVRDLGLVSQMEWVKWCKTHKRPDDIPHSPEQVYKNKGWTTFGDWFGTGNRRGGWLSYEEARKYARKLGLDGHKEWVEYAKKNKKLLEKLKMSISPQHVYKRKGTWISWGDFLGSGTIAASKREFWSFEKAREFVRNLRLKTLADWRKYRKSGKLPQKIPTNPNRTYKKEWKGMRDWLGNESPSLFEKSANFLPWPQAKQKIRELGKKYGLKNRKDWTKFAQTHKNLLEKSYLPANPWRIYTKERVWSKTKK